MSNIILRDTREKLNKGWNFASEPTFDVYDFKLDTGDYSIAGYEKDFVIERKGAISEFANNVNQDRFRNELDRLESFRWPFIILEFNMEDIWNWPASSGIPKYRLKDIKVTNKVILMKLNQIMLKYKTKVIFAGKNGEVVATSLIKRVLEL